MSITHTCTVLCLRLDSAVVPSFKATVFVGDFSEPGPGGVMCACICVYVHTVGIPGTKAYKGGWLVKGVFQWKVSRGSNLSPSRSHSLHHLPSSIPALLSETSLAARVQSSLHFPEIKKQTHSFLPQWYFHTVKVKSGCDSHLGCYGFEFAKQGRFWVHNFILHVSLVLSLHHSTAVSSWHLTLLVGRHHQAGVLVLQPSRDK